MKPLESTGLALLPLRDNGTVRIALWSGGLDSTYTIWREQQLAPGRIDAVHFDYGQRAAGLEREAIDGLRARLGVERVSPWPLAQAFPGGGSALLASAAGRSDELPLRNVVLLTTLFAAALEQAARLDVVACDVIVLSGFRAGEYRDADPGWLEGLFRWVNSYRPPLRFRHLTHADRPREAVAAELPLALRRHTWSCDQPVGAAGCGRCAKCRGVDGG